jgi:glycosyltransferase involved in cell wall biosynthesis
MAIIIYAHDGESLYDSFFLNHLMKDNTVHLLTFSEKPNLVPKGVHIEKMREPFHPTTSPLPGLNTYLGSFLRSRILQYHLNHIKHDVLIGCGGLSYGFYSALSRGSSFVLFIWGSDVLVAPRWLPFRFMAKYSLRKANTVVVDSQVQENACIKLGCDREKIIRFPWVNPTPVLTQIGKNANFQGQIEKAVKERHRWHESDPIVISTRHHEPIYNIECLVEAIPLVLKEVENTRFLFLGRGSLTGKLRRSVETLGVKGNVAFLGWVQPDEIPKYLKASTIYVSTSLSDGTSASLLEAMACKLPSIVTGIPGNREWIVGGENGLLFPVKDSQRLSQNIIRLLRDEGARTLLGTKAYETVVEKANWQRNSKLLDDLISSMVSLK